MRRHSQQYHYQPGNVTSNKGKNDRFAELLYKEPSRFGAAGRYDAYRAAEETTYH